MAHSDCEWTCGCAAKIVKSFKNTCHTWVLLQWWFTRKRHYIKCMHLLTNKLFTSIQTHSSNNTILIIGCLCLQDKPCWATPWRLPYYATVQLLINNRFYNSNNGNGMVWYSKSLTSHSTQYRSFWRQQPWAVMYISHSVMEGQWHNNPLNPRCFCLQRPKIELAPNPHYSGGS